MQITTKEILQESKNMDDLINRVINIFDNDVIDIVHSAMVQAFIDRASPDNESIAQDTALDNMDNMTYGEIRRWALNLTLDDDPLIV